MAIWPALTLPTSDSLSGTTSCIELRSERTANADELELEEDAVDELVELPRVLEAPAPPAAPVVLAADPPEELLAVEALVVPPPDTVSPTCPDSETIVPSSGATSFVSATACSSPCTVSLALRTAARADARLASRVAALTVGLEEDWVLLCLEPSEDEPVEGVCLACDLPELWVVLLGEVEVGALAGVVLLGVVLAGVVAVGPAGGRVGGGGARGCRRGGRAGARGDLRDVDGVRRCA